MSRLFVKNAKYIVTCDATDRVLENSNLLVEDGMITYRKRGAGGR